jgi:hypothetical protein
MAKKKSPPREPEAPPPLDPHEVLRRPANPPRKNTVALLVALALLFGWFVYLVYVAAYG